MKKSISFITLFLITACVAQPNNNINITPLPSASINTLPTNSPKPTESPIPSPTTTPLSYPFPDIKGSFKVNALSGSFDLSIYLDNLGNGVIVSNKLVKVKNFIIEEQSYDYAKTTVGQHTTVNLDNKGNGLIVWGEAPYGCAGDCFSRDSYIWSRKIENYIPVGDVNIVEQSPEISTANPFLKLDENGNGKLIYLVVDKTHYKDVIGFEIQKERKNYQENKDLLIESVRKSVNSKGNGGIVYQEYKKEEFDYPRPTSETIFFRRIENNQMVDEPIPLSLDKYSLKSDPIINLNENGDGIILWHDSYSGDCLYCGGFSTYARYVSNFNIQ